MLNSKGGLWLAEPVSHARLLTLDGQDSWTDRLNKWERGIVPAKKKMFFEISFPTRKWMLGR